MPAPGALTALTGAEAGLASACGVAGTAPAPLPLPDPFFSPPQSWGTRRRPRKAARWRAVSQGPGLGTLRAGGRGASTTRAGRSPEAAGMVQASQRSPRAAHGGPGDQLPSSSTASAPRPPPRSGVRAEREGPDGEIEGEECSPRFSFSLERGDALARTIPQIWSG